MIDSIRRILFVIYAVFLRLPMWGIIWLIGRTGVFKTVFVIYPHDKEEYAKLCPDYQPFIKFMSGRPTPGGVIMDGWKPVGIYLFISNTPQELIKKKNSHIAETIVRRMQWIQKISGAKAIGFAGQLGPILEKRHGIAMEPPFFSSTMGNVFSIEDALYYLAKSENKRPWELSIAILGGGELGEILQEHFSAQGYKVGILDVSFKRRGGVELKQSEANSCALDQVDFVINLLPKGEDFLNSGIINFLRPSTSVIDFSRPRIPREMVQANVVMGNRVQRPGMRFAFTLPGDWKKKEIPACSMPSILASNFGIVEQNVTKFCLAARHAAFGTALASSSQPETVPILGRIHLSLRRVIILCRSHLDANRAHFSDVAKERG
ncbi:MAG: hypothetical protein HKP41_04120 [Desulfobacterales bacterium]|nr:hypothetical protein [Desulfobacterales bacterium]